ncbi:hypothetical protein ACQP1O_18560 [Nocardia sp. CA-151230]|uniref:hypothetical protein n=1 Tax=Nocardia sp. CA-151230 TaxID=3239982 RepID=UPI003D940589
MGFGQFTGMCDRDVLCENGYVKLAEWARGQGVSFRTALNWFHAGILPVAARQLPSGTILVDPPAVPAGRTVAYCRVSCADRRGDLERQAGRVAEQCGQRGIGLDARVTEIGSGLDAHRRKLLADPTVTVVVVEHRSLVVLNPDQVKDDLVEDMVQDMIDVVACMCARLCGRRWARRRAEVAVRAAAGAGE